MRESTSKHDIPTGTLTKRDLLMVSLRLLVVQSAWTSTSMQSEGFVYCITPALKKLYPGTKRLKRIIKHYMTPINTHPFLVGILAGVILKMEQNGQSTKSILAYLRNTMGPLAALGDPFFNGALGPFATVIACIAALQFGQLVGIVTLLVIFNSVHLALRVSGVVLGYKHGASAMPRIGAWIDNRKTILLRYTTGLSGGILIAVIINHFSIPTIPIIAGAGVLGIGVAIVLNMRRAAWVYVLPTFLLATLILEVIV